ncbi:sugar phosphate isomerase/epimerase [Mycobacterium cookii]|uniref:Xylose isomerase n=1 Tax=Mycobacterium cookii TaxID=1775 RepID=A0A7I7KRS3_9MYCO|nr:TIM barrel protein [Mycobacterium cookii]MCV7331222.1 TIM barrel protein [Mycobacterium cookii]BBX44820.1 xylose isomerase [Mycobacterium cookii]
MDRLGIEMLSVFGMPPVEYVGLVADLGCRYITAGLVGFAPLNSLGYPPFSLRDDPALRRDLLAAMTDRGVSISLGEGLLIAPGVDVRCYAADLDVMAELRIPRINTVSLEPDRARTFDQLAALTALAAERGIATCIEPVLGLSIADLPMAVAAVEYVGRDDVSVLIDTMHVARFGARADDLRALPAERIGYIQLSDTTLQPRIAHYAEEAMFERLPPGEGELPLADMLAALPADRVVGLEIPMRSRAEAGVSAYDRLRPCVESARALLADTHEID